MQNCVPPASLNSTAVGQEETRVPGVKLDATGIPVVLADLQ